MGPVIKMENFQHVTWLTLHPFEGHSLRNAVAE